MLCYVILGYVMSRYLKLKICYAVLLISYDKYTERLYGELDSVSQSCQKLHSSPPIFTLSPVCGQNEI